MEHLPTPHVLRRSKFHIVHDVLLCMYNGEYKPTRILYKSNISWTVLDSTLNGLERLGYVHSNKKGPRTEWFLTEEGIKMVVQMDDSLNKVAII